MTNKCRTKMERRELYNVKDLLQGGGGFPGGRGTDSSFVLLVNWIRWEFISSNDEFFPSDCEAI